MIDAGFAISEIKFGLLEFREAARSDYFSGLALFT